MRSFLDSDAVNTIAGVVATIGLALAVVLPIFFIDLLTNLLRG